MLDNKPNQPSQFGTKYWVKINDDLDGTYNTGSQTKFNLQPEGQVYMVIVMRSYLLKEPSELLEMQDHQQEELKHATRQNNERNKGVIFKIVFHSLAA